MRTYTDKSCVRFVKDMHKAGLEVEHYRGRYFWQGPAVRVDSIQDAMSETRVKVQWDQMGRGFIVYPMARDEGIDAEELAGKLAAQSREALS
jgi:hypothetical protein